MDILNFSWLMECEEQKASVPLRSHHYMHMTPETLGAVSGCGCPCRPVRGPIVCVLGHYVDACSNPSSGWHPGIDVVMRCMETLGVADSAS